MYCHDYKCDVCHFVATATFGAIGYYSIDADVRIPAVTAPAWCSRCKTITIAEDLPDLANLLASLRQIDELGVTEFDTEWAAQMDQTPKEFLANRRTNLERFIALQKSRSTKARCVECGAEDFRFLATEMNDGKLPESFPHPGCTGTLWMVDWCLASPATYFLLDRNGFHIKPRKTT